MPNWREEYIHRLTEEVSSEGQVFRNSPPSRAQMGFEYCSFGVRAPLWVQLPRNTGGQPIPSAGKATISGTTISSSIR